jgi:shikimate kinase
VRRAKMAKCEKILICGFSGSGKSSLLEEIRTCSPGIDWNFNDLDHIIRTNHDDVELSQLISNHGWEKFRLWERQALEEWLSNNGKGILSLGGGSLTQIIYDLYRPIRKVRFCYLEAPFSDCWERLHLPRAESRPLIKLGKEKLNCIYEERKKIFSQISWKLQNPKGTDLKLLAKEFWNRLELS